MNYYHFTATTLRDGSPVPKIGEWLELPASVKLKACPSNKDIADGYGGLHASGHPFDALQYAPGSTLHLVNLDGELIEHGSPVDKVAARRRKIVATIDAEPLLREFARKCALSVIHLWDDAAWAAKAAKAAKAASQRELFAEMVDAAFLAKLK